MKIKEFLALISNIVVVTIIVLDYFFGFVLIILSYFIYIFPFFLIYLYSLMDLLLEKVRYGKKVSRIKSNSHAFTLVFLFFTIFVNSEIVKPNLLISATMKDDLYLHQLNFRERGWVENKIFGWAGYRSTNWGRYDLKSDTIYFTKMPKNIYFESKQALVDFEQNAIFFQKNKENKFIVEKEWLNHYKIDTNSIKNKNIK